MKKAENFNEAQKPNLRLVAVISRYIKKYEKHWNIEKGDEIVIGTNNKGTLDIWLIGKDDSWIHLEEIQ